MRDAPVIPDGELRVIVTEALQNSIASGYADELRALSLEDLCCDLYDTCEPVEVWVCARAAALWTAGRPSDDVLDSPAWSELTTCVRSVRELLLSPNPYAGGNYQIVDSD